MKCQKNFMSQHVVAKTIPLKVELQQENLYIFFQNTIALEEKETEKKYTIVC